MRLRRPAAIVGLALLAAACGDDGAGDASAGDDDVPVQATTPSSLPSAAAGAGTAVVDGITYEFEVTGCEFGSTEGAERGVPVRLFALQGAGTGPGEHPLTVQVTRTFTTAETDTFTDVVDLSQPDIDFRVVAERAESDGLIIDLRDPAASSPLLRLGDDHINATGTFGPPGGTHEDPTVPGVLAAACPG